MLSHHSCIDSLLLNWLATGRIEGPGNVNGLKLMVVLVLNLLLPYPDPKVSNEGPQENRQKHHSLLGNMTQSALIVI